MQRAGRSAVPELYLQLSDIPDGCRVVMEEYPVSGPGAILPSRLSDLAAWPRNRETLWRLGSNCSATQTD